MEIICAIDKINTLRHTYCKHSYKLCERLTTVLIIIKVAKYVTAQDLKQKSKSHEDQAKTTEGVLSQKLHRR